MSAAWRRNSARIGAAILVVAALLLSTAVPRASGQVVPDLVRDTVGLGTRFTDLARLDTTIRLDIRYATARNFLNRPVYPTARALLRRPAAEALLRAHRHLLRQGYGLLVFDCYRPWSVTKLFWDSTPPERRAFVADPARGSRHNRGCAVDCTLYDRVTGAEVPMPSAYDEFSGRAASNFAGGTARERGARDILRSAMEKEGFTVEPLEWWHFDFAGWKSFPLYDVPLELFP
jgi:D-alanyl-D-alanine dipeptidase